MYVEAAHRNPPGSEAAQRLHGHSYRVEIVVSGEVTSDLGWLVDYADIKKAFQPLYDQLDHHYLNEVEGLNDPSLPGVRRWIFERLKPKLPGLQDVRVSIVGRLAFEPETLPPDPEAGLPARLFFTVEAAQHLPQLPPEHKCVRLHGHSYRFEIGAHDLDRLRPCLEAVYNDLDHRCLNDIPGMEQATCERICRWLWERLLQQIDDLTVVVVKETDTASCVYFGE